MNTEEVNAKQERNEITVSWSMVKWYRATIDLNDPAYEGLTPDDFDCGTEPSDRVDEVLFDLTSTGECLQQVDGLEVTLIERNDK